MKQNDKGAHFYKSDFQVHTPRDARWNGAEAVTDTERKAYADELVLACRQKGLGAIAVTDHHDFGFFPYIKKATQDELDSSGQPVPEIERIVAFPGIELTLTAPACQVILILDADFPENLLPSVLTALSISPSPATEAKHATIQRVPQNVVSDLSDLYDKLSSHAHIKGRFIVLPNVSETGHGTMLRSGFGNFYKTMPSVGGYVDGSVTKFGKGNLDIVEGKNRDYGFKAIGVFQTSDNRKRDHSDLGKHTTWVKWSAPTAEALRQACLARESRLSQNEPQLPGVWIASVSVSSSKFLGNIDLDFNQQYNAIIGGRGTGKSTILEYLRWGLCDQPVESEEEDSVQNRRKNLIKNTLQNFEGEIIVTFLINDVRHIVKRNSKTQEILLKIGDSPFASVTEQQVRSLLPIQAYSQKQLSRVGDRIDELKRFVELPIKQDLDEIRSEVRDTEAKTRSAYGDLIRMNEIKTEIDKNDIESKSLAKQLEGLRKGLKGLSESDQKIIDQKAKYDAEQSIIEDLQNELTNTEQRVQELVDSFSEDEREEQDDAELENTKIIESIRSEFAIKFGEIKVGIKSVSNLFKPASLKSVNDKIKEWDKLKSDFDKKYETAKANAQVNQQQLDQIQAVEKRILVLKKMQTEKRNALIVLGDPENVYTDLRKKWDQLHARRVEVMEKQCMEFTALSSGLIKADVKSSLDTNALMLKLKTIFTGMNIKEDKIEKICQCLLKATDPITEWNAILAELEQLSLYSEESTDGVPETPILKQCGFILSECTRIAEGLNSTGWIDLSVSELQFKPKFLYCTNKDTDEYIEFADASAGQQATALLTVLLNQNGAPLIIDQPEDDIDSKMIREIIEQVWKAKSKRQLVFASHSANFVVNGDAELVVCCDYRKTDDQTKGMIKLAGAIDIEEIKDEITLVTEGGREAFKLRMDKYGF